MKFASTLLLALAPAALAQTATPVKKPVVHHAATSATAGTLPPNIPRVPGIAKPLYALRYIDIKLGTGDVAAPQKFYTVKYTGWLAKDGTKFDSSYDHPGQEPITFPYGAHRVIPGWDTGFEGMHVGGKRRIFIPWQLAYGDTGRPPVIPAKADLIFDMELVAIADKPPAPPAPPKPAPSDTPTPEPGHTNVPPAPPAPASAPKAPAPPAGSPAARPETDPATNDPAKATTPDNNPKTAPPAKPTPQ